MDTSTQTLTPNPLEQPQVADTPKAEQQSTPEMAEAVSVERLRGDVQATLARAETTRDRINSIELPHGDSPRLQELKQQSEAVFKKLEQLVFAMMDTERTAQDQSRLQKLTTEVKRDLKAMKQPLNQEEARASKPVVKEAPELEPQQAEIPTTTIEPEPVIEAPKPIETREEPARTEQRRERDAFWAELKSKLGDRAYAADMLHKVEDQLNQEITPQIKEVMKRIERSDKKNENPEQLISTIVELQARLGGEEYAQKVQSMLNEWTQNPKERIIFDSSLGPVAFSKINATIGTEGIEARLKAAKAKTKGVSDKLWGMIGYSEVQSLEGQKRTLLAALNVAMDKLVGRMQDENKLTGLEKRKASLTQTEESITRQVQYDKALRQQVSHTELLDFDVASALRELEQFVNHLPTQAKETLIGTFPSTIPADVADHMSLRERQTYSQLVANYEGLRNAFDRAVNETSTLYTGGLANYERGLVSEALTGTEYEVEDDFSTSAEALATPDRARRLAADDIERFAKTEFDIAREKAIEEWKANTEKDVMQLVRRNHGELLARDPRADDFETFNAYHMPNEGLRTIMLLDRLGGSLVTAENEDEIEDTLERKKALLVELDKILREQPLREVIPSLDTRKKPSEMNKPLDGTKTLSPEEAEIAEQNAITDTKAPEYAQKKAGTDTVAPDYAIAEQAKNEAETKNEQFWNDALALSGLFHEKMRSLTHSELLAHEKTWEHLRKLDSMIVLGKKVSELSEEDKTDLIKAIFQLDYDLRANTSIENYVFFNGENALKIQNTLDALDVSMDKAIPLAMSISPEPSAEENLKASYKLVEEQRARQAASEEAETIAIPEPEVAKPRVPKKPLRTAAEAVAAAQRKPRKTPPRSNQSTRPPAIAA